MGKRFKESCSSANTSGHWDIVMEDLGTEIDLVISRLSDLKTKTEELNFTTIGLQTKVNCFEE